MSLMFRYRQNTDQDRKEGALVQILRFTAEENEKVVVLLVTQAAQRSMDLDLSRELFSVWLYL